ncbi:ATP-binding protein [Altericroceibacterium spongiae]|uniref:ATP-binding protein n=2 Tax=Altericroceibacterium spongiae TaxID=2320269 RepID=A0A420EJ50_9SPHN|nr:ATP-binding protein [Altericroceibacterium spongiae]
MDEALRGFTSLNDTDRTALFSYLTEEQKKNLHYCWDIWARPEQLPPAAVWRLWLICAGRGFGKTRAGAEWVIRVAREDPEARIALVGASLNDVRSIMVEGESGILACARPARRPSYEPSLRRLQWPGGAQALLYSSAEPESLRGPQHSHAWCDEVAKWDNASSRALKAWDNLQLGMRLSENPQILATSTPRAVPLMQRLLAQESEAGVVVTRGSSFDNAANLPHRFMADIQHRFGGTTLGRQELLGEMLGEVDGALWSRALLERCRVEVPQPLIRIVVGVDPPASAHGDLCGIIVAGIGEDGHGRVLADASLGPVGPERWARQVALTAQSWQADRVVAEANQGGAMVESVLRAADCAMPVRLVHASRGKSARAEPVAALYEAGRITHAAQFPALEDQLCGMMAGGSYEGPGRSPDRADALVWALTELLLTRRTGPRVLTF